MIFIAFTICFSILAAGATIGIIEIFNSKVDTTDAVNKLADATNTLIGALLGFISGRSTAEGERARKELDNERGNSGSSN